MFTILRHLTIALVLLSVSALFQVCAQPTKDNTVERNQLPVLANTCVISDNIKRLVAFYEPVLKQKAKWSGDDYAEFATGGAVLSIFFICAGEVHSWIG